MVHHDTHVCIPICVSQMNEFTNEERERERKNQALTILLLLLHGEKCLGLMSQAYQISLFSS